MIKFRIPILGFLLTTSIYSQLYSATNNSYFQMKAQHVNKTVNVCFLNVLKQKHQMFSSMSINGAT